MHFSGETSRKNLFTVIKSVLLMFVARSRQKFFFEFEDRFAGFTVFFVLHIHVSSVAYPNEALTLLGSTGDSRSGMI